MESTYLYYPKRKIYDVLLSELPKRGYRITHQDAILHSITVRKKLALFFSRASLMIQMEDSGTTITKVHCSENEITEQASKYTPELIQEILRIF